MSKPGNSQLVRQWLIEESVELTFPHCQFGEHGQFGKMIGAIGLH